MGLINKFASDYISWFSARTTSLRFAVRGSLLQTLTCKPPVASVVLVVLFGVSSVLGEDNPTLDELLEIDVQPREVEKEADEGEWKEEAEVDDPKVSRDIEGDGNPADVFEQVVKEMGDAADRLGELKDTGLVTQRIQQDVIAKLDKIIDAASKSGGGKGKGQPQKKEQGSKKNQQGSKKQGKQPGSQPNQGTPTRGEVGDAAESGVMQETREQWGQLPPRLRDELSQGQNETFSGMYRSMTEEYYQRVAEESE